MSKIYTSILVSLLMVIMSVPVIAQDTLDVSADGIGTLNAAIDGDTLSDGTRNPDRVYRLARDAAYLIAGSMTVSGGYTMRIVGAKGSGHRPMLIPMADDGGISRRHFWVTGDGEWKSLYLTNVDDFGLNPKQGKNMFRFNSENSRFLLEDCYLDGDSQGFFRMNSANEKLYVRDCIFRNAAQTADPWEGLIIGARGGFQDTIFFENNTMFAGSNKPIQDYGGIIKNLIFNHNTFFAFGGVQGGNFDVQQTINYTFTNNVVWDIGFEGDDGEVVPEILPIDPLTADSSIFGTDADRNIKITNNVYGWSPEITAWIESKPTATATGTGPSLLQYVWHDSLTDSLMNLYPNMVSEKNLEEALVFSDPPDITVFTGYAESRYYTNYDNTNNADLRVWRNGLGNLYENPDGYGLAADEFDFDYQTTAAAYTYGEGGFPVGDLNWFPDKKAEWENWLTSIDQDPGTAAVPASFALEQNYPNPFNPTTTIEYNLNAASKVTLTIYNALGQVVNILVNTETQKAGSYSIQWNGRDGSGRFVSSGLYFYRLDSDNQTMSKKMLLLK